MTWSKWFVEPAFTSIFFLLGVLTLYWFLTSKLIKYMENRGQHPNANHVRTIVGLIYMVILLITTQASVSGTDHSWVFTNFQIFAVVFVSYFLMLEIRVWQFALATLLFMLIDGTLTIGLSWAYAVVYIGFYLTMKNIKHHLHSPWRNYMDFASTALLFSAILWWLMRLRFHLSWSVISWEILFSFVLLTIMYIYVDSLLAGADTLAQLTYTTNYDELTRVHNFYSFKRAFGHQFKDAQTEKHPLTLMLFDIDHFKHVNDTYGHLTGDYVLTHVAGLITQQLKAIDPSLILYRTGGEEFTIIFDNYTVSQAREHVDAIAQSVREAEFQHAGKTIDISISVGITQLKIDDGSQVDLYRRADESLYYSKRHGRDQVTIG
ncbi:GGDEF domain-containing protein [Levilactobacillus fuyuanensis]|uniref:GGDEF domain-containing protein n=1 Tax=Levilactobacillus fuyuanensis TaxID=2486022 RepID=A0ABW4H638_9LACO|nr:GGDEF domain-containing protein [Levilactobacillus fuyuanensis]